MINAPRSLRAEPTLAYEDHGFDPDDRSAVLEQCAPGRI